MKEMDTSPYPLSSPTPELRNAPGGGRGGDGGACAGDANSYINCAKKAKCRAAKTPRASEGGRERAAMQIGRNQDLSHREGGRPAGRSCAAPGQTDRKQYARYSNEDLSLCAKG